MLMQYNAQAITRATGGRILRQGGTSRIWHTARRGPSTTGGPPAAASSSLRCTWHITWPMISDMIVAISRPWNPHTGMIHTYTPLYCSWGLRLNLKLKATMKRTRMKLSRRDHFPKASRKRRMRPRAFTPTRVGGASQHNAIMVILAYGQINEKSRTKIARKYTLPCQKSRTVLKSPKSNTSGKNNPFPSAVSSTKIFTPTVQWVLMKQNALASSSTRTA
mmetsp:Transcript_90481/g.242294  ORF Transcript_90481/g.242294 Transcript_90481/m.242294 type:complete len:220 (-) Transcript_90481:1477-2136(-)